MDNNKVLNIPKTTNTFIMIRLSKIIVFAIYFIPFDFMAVLGH